jgi:hypothetical protein
MFIILMDKHCVFLNRETLCIDPSEKSLKGNLIELLMLKEQTITDFLRSYSSSTLNSHSLEIQIRHI